MNGTRGTIFLASSTNIDHIDRVLGDDILLLDGTDASIIHELVKLIGTRGNFPETKVGEVVDNMRALKAYLENETGTEVLTIPLCKETSAMENEVRIAGNAYYIGDYEASLQNKPPRREWVSKILSALRSMIRHPDEHVKLGDQQMPQMGEK